MLQLRDYALANVLAFPVILSIVPSKCTKDRDATPLGTLVEGDEQFIEHCAGNDKYVLARSCCGRGQMDIGECSDCVRYDLREV